MWLGQIQIMDHARQRLMSLDPRLLRVVIAKGSLSDARNPTAVVNKRISEVLEMRPGDWCCNNCADLQFSAKRNCRKCGTPKPWGV